MFRFFKKNNGNIIKGTIIHDKPTGHKKGGADPSAVTSPEVLLFLWQEATAWMLVTPAWFYCHENPRVYKALLRAYLALVSLDTALLDLYFSGGTLGGVG